MAAKNTMKAARIYEYGDSGVFRYEDAEKPVPGPGELLVKVAYSSVNPFDWKVRSGYMKENMPLKLPAILGIDTSGTIEAVGSNAKRFKVGDKVFGRASFANKGGSYAEYIVVGEDQMAAVPNGVSLQDAAGIPVAAGTASAFLDLAGLKKGQRILITGASGGVGLFAVQLAKARGAYVIGTSSSENFRLLKSLGADETIDYRNEDFSSKVRDLDVVLDTVGGETFEKAHKVLRKGGTLVTTAARPDDALAKKYGISVKSQSAGSDPKRLEEIAQMVAQKKVKVIVAKVFPLSEIKAAHEMSEGRHANGKILLKVA